MLSSGEVKWASRDGLLISLLTPSTSLFLYSAYHDPVVSLLGGKAGPLLEWPQEGAPLPTVYWGALPSRVWPLVVEEEPARPSLALLLGDASIAQKNLSPDGLRSWELLHHVSSSQSFHLGSFAWATHVAQW